VVAGLEKDYAAWCQAFWKAVWNGLKGDGTSTKKHKACKHSGDDKCCCKTDNDQNISSQVLVTDFRLYTWISQDKVHECSKGLH